jgi:PTH1 family peptidyl-tRNA hydrolase
MKLIVGLGNPGKEYSKTRHNVGFNVLDYYLGDVSWKEKKDALYYVMDNKDEQIIFIKPTTYMNLSGIAVKYYVNYYKIDINDILVIQDDLDLDVGNYKLKRNSSSGGHNGIKSIIESLNTDSFLRLKIGIGKSLIIPTDKYVLSKFKKNEINSIESNYETFKDIINTFINDGVEKVLSEYNKH